ncbi:TlpA family protein disulfide reductase [Candidatus Pristimantibacillus sp. PTI5]|uniref:TlpA family protein disulfide reductase n=1 Tax=Candidatus Pristimantibacillus sp. PTI5 TaxID=3400422 RepID=UPI003B02688F
MDTAIASFPNINGEESWLGSSRKREELLQKNFLFVYLWSISCGYCKEVIPHVINFHRENIQSFHLLSIHVPMGDHDLDVSYVQDEANKLGISDSLLLDNNHKWVLWFGSKFLPSFYIYNQAGQFVNSKIGYENIEEFLQGIG